MAGEWTGTLKGETVDKSKRQYWSKYKKGVRQDLSIEGLDELQKKFADLIAVANTEPVVDALTQWASNIANTSKANLQHQLQPPPDSGALEDAHFVDARDPFRQGPDIGPSVLAGGINKPAFYGSFFEHGTVHQPARPYFRPAVAAHRGDSKLVMAALRKVINKAANGRPARVLLKPRRTPVNFSWK